MLENGNGNGLFMPVAPMGMGGGFGNNGFGGDGWWILLLLLFAGGWGNNGFGGGMFGGNDIYPWMNQANLTSNGFQNQMLNDNITSIRDGIHELSTQLCNSFAQAEIADNARQMADMQQMFSIQSALQNCCCENRAGIADLKYTVATENCADRTQSMQNTRDIIESQTRSTQAVLDKLCQLELDGKNDRIADLERQLTMANLSASQVRQTADITNGVYERLSTCPVGTVPVYGEQAIFRCNNNGCGCGNF